MMRSMLKSKIHRATVTDANLRYEGSLTVDRALMDAVGLLPFEAVDVYDINNGERFSTYVIEGPPDSGIICVNGAAARKVAVGDLVIVASYAFYSDAELADFQPAIILLDADNRIRRQLAPHPFADADRE
ncbi:MAG: aspartate 1-decarboxylase [Thermodesulfobacteriota bacterium]